MKPVTIQVEQVCFQAKPAAVQLVFMQIEIHVAVMQPHGHDSASLQRLRDKPLEIAPGLRVIGVAHNGR